MSRDGLVQSKPIISYHDISYDYDSIETYYGKENNENNYKNTGNIDDKLDNNQTTRNGSHKDESPTLYIGGLSFGCTEDVIREHFSRFGTILNIRLAMDRETGKPKG